MSCKNHYCIMELLFLMFAETHPYHQFTHEPSFSFSPSSNISLAQSKLCDTCDKIRGLECTNENICKFSSAQGNYYYEIRDLDFEANSGFKLHFSVRYIIHFIYH